jgi:hypothetical protein
MIVKDFISKDPTRQYHIFDSHQEKMADRGKTHRDQDFQVYTYNIHHNNKPKEGDVFLYRRPGKSSKTRKFYIYGGGIIEDISSPNDIGDVRVTVSNPFKFDTPIVQGDEMLENMVWTSKKKKPGSWGHFWNQYGMNTITEEEFFYLAGDREYTVPDNVNIEPASIEEMQEENEVVNSVEPENYTLVVEDKTTKKKTTRTTKLKPYKVDYEKLNKTKQTVGLLGEMIVMDYLMSQLEGTDYKLEHKSLTDDSAGYDILAYNKDGNKVLIEVKTTTSKSIDGFYLSSNELETSKRTDSEYYIYRVYDLDKVKKTAELKIYKTPLTDDEFRVVPVSYKVYTK